MRTFSLVGAYIRNSNFVFLEYGVILVRRNRNNIFLYIFLLVYMDFEKRATALNGAWGMTFVRVRIQKVLSEGVQL